LPVSFSSWSFFLGQEKNRWMDGAVQPALRKPDLASEDGMTDGPDNPDRPQIYGSDREVIDEAIRLLAELDDTPLNQMTSLYYQHGFEELRMLVGDLLRILGHNLDG